jgi:type I restriction enzyme, S subunit
MWLSGGTPNRTNPRYWDGGIPWISAASLKKTRIDNSDQCVTEAGLRAGSRLAPTGATLVLVRGMTLHREARIGLATRPVSFNQDIKALVPKSGIMPEFLVYSLQARSDQILDLVSSAGSGTGVLDTGLLKRLPIWVPARHEQQQIVDSVTVADRSIEALERLIVKKQAIKQGMMQQLLTGRTRLLGFTGEWSKASLGDIASITRGASPRPIASSRWFSDASDVGWVRIADVGRSDGIYLRTTTQRLSPDGIARSRYLRPGTLIMSIAATVGVPIITGIPACIHDGFVAIQGLRSVDQMYLLYTLKSMQDELRSSGQTGSQANVNTDIVKRLQIALPPLSEQKAIAAALLDMDNLIANLERVTITKQAVKKGMMQQLLTGRVRLPVQETAT